MTLQGLPGRMLLQRALMTSTLDSLSILEFGGGSGSPVGIFLAQTIPRSRVLLASHGDHTESASATIGASTPAVGATIHFAPCDDTASLSPEIRNRSYDVLIMYGHMKDDGTYTAPLELINDLATRRQGVSILLVMKGSQSDRDAVLSSLFDLGYHDARGVELPFPGLQNSEGPAADAFGISVFEFYFRSRSGRRGLVRDNHIQQ